MTQVPYAQYNPYEIWSLRKSLGIFRAVMPTYAVWMGMMKYEITSTDEWIDFEKLPYKNRKLAPFVMPAGAGRPIYADRGTGYRFKPAYIKLKDAVDPNRILRKIAGLESMLNYSQLTPQQRRELLKVAIAEQHAMTIERRWEWLAARAIIDGQVTISGPEYPTQLVDFQRNANQTVVLSSGSRWGDSGVSILSYLQTWADQMLFPTQNSDGTGGFGGYPVRIDVGTSAWKAMRQDAEIKDMMNKFYPATGVELNRALTGPDKVTKVGNLGFGGTSGAQVEVWLNRDTYQDDNGVETPFLAPTDVVLTASPEAIQGYQCYGAIIDPFAQYQALPVFARNWMTEDDPAAEYMLHQSAPLMVPVNPNATFKATVVAE